MQTGFRGRDLISLSDWTTEEIETILDIAATLKRERALGIGHPLLRDKVLAMLFFFSSTRTRASFEAGMAQLGGHAQFIESRTTQIAHGDTPKEIGEILGRYNDGIAIRHVDWGEGNKYIREVAAASRVPVLNMQCDLYHPHQILADLMTMREKLGNSARQDSQPLVGVRRVATRSRSASRQDLVTAATRFGMNVRLVHPPEFKLMPEVVDEAAANARAAGGSLELMDDFDAGFRGADVVYAKSWGALLTAKDETEGAEIAKRYTSWITDRARMALANDHAIFMHPLPADRNVEVADAVIDGPQSVVYDEAENRLHAQKAVMAADHAVAGGIADGQERPGRRHRRQLADQGPAAHERARPVPGAGGDGAQHRRASSATAGTWPSATATARRSGFILRRVRAGRGTSCTRCRSTCATPTPRAPSATSCSRTWATSSARSRSTARR